jgi:hemerythrin-like domain-containing protein
VKRSEELAPLSRDHHHGLFAALALRRATSADATAARSTFLEFWQSEGRRHFAIEEEVLLPGFARRGPADHEAVVRVLVEHVDLRRRAQELAEDQQPRVTALHELGDLLQAHIRHEENILFPLIESTLTHEELVTLGSAIARAEDQ